MSDPSPPLKPCLLCQSVAEVRVQRAENPFLSGLLDGRAEATEPPTAGYLVVCLACQLRSAWRPTEAAAIRRWNYQVTPDLAESGSEGA
jgi:hypothetical protein